MPCAGRGAGSVIVVFVDRKDDLAFLIILSRQRRAPVDDLQIQLTVFSDIITVVPLLVVHKVHPRKIRFDKETLVALDLLPPFADLRIQTDDGAVILRGELPFAQSDDLIVRILDPEFELVDVARFQEGHHNVHARRFVRALLLLVQQVEEILFIRLLAAADKFSHLLFGHFRHRFHPLPVPQRKRKKLSI